MNGWLFFGVMGLCLFLGIASRVDHSGIGWWFARRMFHRADTRGWGRACRRITWRSTLGTYRWRGLPRWTDRLQEQASADTSWAYDRSAVVAGKLLGTGHLSADVARYVARYQDFLPDTQRKQLAAHLDRDVT